MEFRLGTWDGPPPADLVLRLVFPGGPGGWGRWALMADFASRFLVDVHGCPGLVNSLSFVLNELIENAVKYGGEGEVDLGLFHTGDRVTLEISNSVTPAALAVFLPVAQALGSRTESLPGSFGPPSGIGLLTLVNFYRATLGFRFQTDRVAVQVQLSLQELSHEN